MDVGYLATGTDCSQPPAPDIPAIQARLRADAARTRAARGSPGAGTWSKLREGRHPTRAGLDAAVPDRPAILFHTSLHACVLNTPRSARQASPTGSPIHPAAASGGTARAGSTGWSTRARHRPAAEQSAAGHGTDECR
jgi:predicted amidohydrolase YtcJ